MAPSIEQIVRHLRGHRYGGGWMCRCPMHDDNKPSLSIRITPDRRLLVHCFAGCAGKEVYAAICDMGFAGQHATAITDRQPTIDREAKRRQALRTWANALSPAGTLAEAYLAARCLRLPDAPCLRFEPDAWHPSGQRFPAMLAAIENALTAEHMAIQRTYLSPDGQSKAPVQPSRMIFGRCRGGVIRLSSVSCPLLIGEGLETCLSAFQQTDYATWAAISAGGLQTLDLPRQASDIILLVDGDRAGEQAAGICSKRWLQEGRKVRIAKAPPGMDFNDVLMAEGVCNA